jgi:type 1 glutamine amidotransferase
MFRHSALLTALLIVAPAATAQQPTVDKEDATKPKVLLLGQSPDDHPRLTHEYMAGVRVIAKALQQSQRVEVTVARADGPWPEGPELIRKADVVVVFVAQGAKWIHEDPRRLEAFAQLAGRGGGLVGIHWGLGTKEQRHVEGAIKLFGGVHGGPDRKYQVVTTDVTIPAQDHPVMRGVKPGKWNEEFYYQMKLTNAANLTPLMQAEIDGKKETVAWAWQRSNGGRSFGFTGGHFHQNWKQERYYRMLTQAVIWTAKVEIPASQLLPIELTPADFNVPDLALEPAEPIEN